MRDYCIYLEGNGVKDPLFCRSRKKCSRPMLPILQKGEKEPRSTKAGGLWRGERAMQLQSDPFLGWTTLEGHDYLVRQLNDHKASVQVEELRNAELVEYAAVCGELLARSHARSGDCLELAGYLGRSTRFDDAVVEFATAYADQTEKDWKELRDGSRRPGERRGPRLAQVQRAG
jgi:hypothetical protein